MRYTVVMTATVIVTIAVIALHASFVAGLFGNTCFSVVRLSITTGSDEALKHTRTSLVLSALC